MPELIASLDLGQKSDYTAYAIVEKSDGPRPVYDVRRLVRFKDVSYPDVVAYVCRQHTSEPLAGVPLVIDATGLGRAVVDMFVAAEVNAIVKPITITGGNKWALTETGDYRVPKVDLVGVLQMLLPAGRLRAAPRLGIRKDGSGDDLSALLKQEMQDFRVKFTKQAHEIYNAREGKHDDIVLAVSMACWLGENVFTGTWDARQHPAARSVVDMAPAGLFQGRPYGEADDDMSSKTPSW